MRRTALAAGGAALAIALAGCGGGGGGKTVAGDPQPLFGNTQKLANAASTEATDAETTKFSMELKGAGKSMHGQGKMRFAGQNTAMSMTMSAADQNIEFRMLDQVFYFKVPKQLSSMMNTDKPWLKIPLNGDGKMAQTFGKMLKKNMGNADPTKLLERVDKAGEITKKERTANGSHYWVKINMTKMIEQTNPELADKLPQQAEKKFAGTTIPAQIWLNKDSLPTKITMDMAKVAKATGQAQNGQGMSMSGKIVTKYHDWGKPVEVKAPPKDQVGTFEMPNIGNMPN